MEPGIPDGSYCLFAARVTGTRQGRIVLVQPRGATDPETGHRYTVKRYQSETGADGDAWKHTKIILKPMNSAYAPIVLTEVQVIAELVEVLGTEAPGSS